MALVKCPECGNEVSTTAAACPKCGYVRMPGASGGPGAAVPLPPVMVPASTMPGWIVGLIVVICVGVIALPVCGIMAAVAIPKLLSAIEKSKIGAASGDLGAFNSALALYQVDIMAKRFPTTMNQLLTDNAAGWSGPYMATISPDPWNNAYTYTTGASNYTIMSVHTSEYNRSETIRYILGDGILSTLP